MHLQFIQDFIDEKRGKRKVSLARKLCKEHFATFEIVNNNI
jgi:hypothetical protein